MHTTKLVYALPDGGRIFVGTVAAVPRERDAVKIVHDERDLGVFFVLGVGWEVNAEVDHTTAVVKLSREP